MSSGRISFFSSGEGTEPPSSSLLTACSSARVSYPPSAVLKPSRARFWNWMSRPANRPVDAPKYCIVPRRRPSSFVARMAAVNLAAADTAHS